MNPHFAALLAQLQDPQYRYDTKLERSQEGQFGDWLSRESKVAGRDLSRDTNDYDLRGYFQDYGGASVGSGHMGDRYKKPNHPTFSDESKYSGVGGNVGGHWGDGWYMPSPHMLSSTHDMGSLLGYFRSAPPGDPDRDYRVLMPPVDVVGLRRRAR